MWGKACLIRIGLSWLSILPLFLSLPVKAVHRSFTGLSFSKRPLRVWLIPNFSDHWGNWVLPSVVAFLMGYLPSAAFAADYFYRQGSYAIFGPTPESVCVGTYKYYDPDPSYPYGVCRYTADLNSSGQPIYRYDCPTSPHTNQDINDVCFPVEPECPDSGTLYSGEVFASGTVGSGYADADGCQLVPNWVPTYCDYAGAESEECLTIDGYKYGDPEPPPKSCTDEDGRYIGQVSGNAHCPSVQRDRCYNPDGTLAYIVDAGTSCPAGTSTENTPDSESVTDSDIDPETGEPTGEKTTGSTETTDVQVIENPDGSVTTITTTTRTNADGSTSTTTKTSTVNADGSSTESTETTGSAPPSGVSGGATCVTEPSCSGDPLQCYQIKQQWRSDCGKNELLQGINCGDKFVCQGTPIDCFRIRIERDQYCSAAETVASFEPEQFHADFASAVGLTESDMVNQEGEILGLWQEVDLADSGLGEIDLSGGGASGSCPSPLKMPFGAELSFEPLCEVAGMIRYLVIGGTALYCLFIINSGVLQGRRKS